MSAAGKFRTQGWTAKPSSRNHNLSEYLTIDHGAIIGTPTPEPSDFKPRGKILNAYCDSNKCVCKDRGLDRVVQISNLWGSPQVKKDVPRSASNCPDCGHALFWKRE